MKNGINLAAVDAPQGVYDFFYGCSFEIIKVDFLTHDETNDTDCIKVYCPVGERTIYRIVYGEIGVV